jgi:hypothetical protein
MVLWNVVQPLASLAFHGTHAKLLEDGNVGVPTAHKHKVLQDRRVHSS